MNILLCGGAGYIGTHTIIELDKAGHSVVVVDNFSKFKARSVETCFSIDRKRNKVLRGRHS